MDDQKKKVNGAESLDEAGLLDEIEGGWTLPEPAVPGSTIRVKSRDEEYSDLEIESEVSPSDPTVKRQLDSDTLYEKSAVQIDVEAEVSHSDPTVKRITSPFVGDPSPKPIESAPAMASPVPKKARSTLKYKNDSEFHGQLEDGLPDLEPPEPEPSDDPGGSNPMDLLEMADLRRDDPSAKMQELFAVGDYASALNISEDILQSDPDNEEAINCNRLSRDSLMQIYRSRISALDRVPVVTIGPNEVIWRKLDPEAGFILSRIDGQLSFEDIIDISSLSDFKTYQILNKLLQDGIIK